MKKRILIYGNDKSFSKYLKWKFQEVLLFDVCKDFKHLKYDLSVYSIVVLVIYKEEDLNNFFKIYKIGTPIVVCSFNKRAMDFLEGLSDVVLLDTSKIRSEILQQLHFYFQDKMLNIQA